MAPVTFDVDDEKDLRSAISSEGTVWLRPKTGAGGKGSIVVSDYKFGWMWIEYWKQKGFSSSWIAQEYLKGGNYNVTLIYDRESNLCGMGMLERLGYIHEAISPTGVTGDVRLAETLKLDNIIAVAKKAVELGLKVKPWVKTSLAPGSKVVSDYLDKADLSQYLNKIGFNLVGYGCTTCIGNSGPLNEWVSKEIKENDLTVCSVLSGNRNFEGRVHQEVKANFLASPPLVVAFAIAGNMNINLFTDPLGCLLYTSDAADE